MRKLKIALIAYEFYPNPGGIAHVVSGFCKSFPQEEHSLIVFNQDFKGKYNYNILNKRECKLKDLFLLLKNKKSLYYLILSIWKILSEKKLNFTDKLMIILYLLIKPRILITTMRNINSISPYFKKYKFNIVFGGGTGWYTLILIFLLSKIFNTKVVAITHGNDFLIRTPLSLKSYYLKNLDIIFLATERLKDILIEVHHLNNNKIIPIPHGLIFKEYKILESKEDLRKEFNLSEDQFVLLSGGRHVSRKKFDLVIKAIKILKERIPSINIKYILFGEGKTTPELKKLVKNLDLDNEVIFPGYVDKITRNKFYKLSDLFLMPSIAESESIEGFGIVFVESNYFKTPVIGTFSGGIADTIIDGKTGLLIKTNDLDDLVEKILELYKNKELRNKMGKNGHIRVIENFDWNKNINDYIKYLKEIL